MFEAIRWPEDMTPSRFHFTNELEVAASPQNDLVGARGSKGMAKFLSERERGSDVA